MPVTTLNISDDLNRKLGELKTHYGATSNVEIFRKALALLMVSKNAEQEDGSVIIKDRNNKEIKVVMT